MAIYLITPLTNKNELHAEIKAAIEERDRYFLDTGACFIKFDGTSRELSEKLKISAQEPNQPTSTALVTPISAYYGRAPSDIWEWLESRSN